MRRWSELAGTDGRLATFGRVSGRLARPGSPSESFCHSLRTSDLHPPSPGARLRAQLALSQIDADHEPDKGFFSSPFAVQSPASPSSLPHEALATFVSTAAPIPGPPTFIPAAPYVPPSSLKILLSSALRLPLPALGSDTHLVRLFFDTEPSALYSALVHTLVHHHYKYGGTVAWNSIQDSSFRSKHRRH